MCFRQNETRVNLTLTLELALTLTQALTLTLSGPKQSRVHERKKIHRTTTVDSRRNPESQKVCCGLFPCRSAANYFGESAAGLLLDISPQRTLVRQ